MKVAVGASGLAGAVPDTVPTLGRSAESGVSHKSGQMSSFLFDVIFFLRTHETLYLIRVAALLVFRSVDPSSIY